MNESRKERLVLFITTLAGISCILQNHFGEWEFWMPWVVLVIGIILWWVHLAEKIDSYTRMIFYYAYAAFLLFYHGIHDTSLFDLSVSAALFIATFTVVDRTIMLNLILVEYAIVMAIQFYFLYINNRTDMSAFDIMRIVYHVGTVLVMYVFSRITVISRIMERDRIDKWQESVEKNDDDMEDFLANISHELRTPVNVISGMTTILQKNNDNEQLSSIKEAGLRLANQIEDIQDYTEIKRGELVLEEENYKCVSLINDVVADYNYMYKNSDRKLIIDMSPDMPSVLYGDIRKLHKLFRHILDNAVKFSRIGNIYVKVFTESHEYGVNLTIEITDRGIGMTRADMARVSKGMYQANKKRNRSTGGIGIGLSIVYGFVHKMGGFVMIDSEKKKGTTVRLSIPQKVINPAPCQYHNEETGSDKCLSEDNQQVRFAGVKSLVVDDEPMNLVVASGIFKEYKMNVDTSLSGKDAIVKYETGDYDVIFMDHMMPEMDGVEAMKRIKQVAAADGRNAIIVALTANALSGSREMFMREGFDGFIAKPIDIGEFERVMKHVLPDDKIQYERGESKDA